MVAQIGGDEWYDRLSAAFRCRKSMYRRRVPFACELKLTAQLADRIGFSLVYEEDRVIDDEAKFGLAVAHVVLLPKI